MEDKGAEGFHGEEKEEERRGDPCQITRPSVQKEFSDVCLNKRLVVVLVGFWLPLEAKSEIRVPPCVCMFSHFS